MKKCLQLLLIIIVIFGFGIYIFNSLVKENNTLSKQNLVNSNIGRNDPIDYKYYLGEWISSDTPFKESLNENGGLILEISDVNNGLVKGTCKIILNNQDRQQINMKFESKLKSNRLDFEYTDNLSNKGNAYLIFDGERIRINFSMEIKQDSPSRWDFGNGQKVFERARIHVNTESLKNVISYFDMDSNQISDSFGIYKQVSVSNPNITLFITNQVEWIECSSEVDINGAHAGMNFARNPRKTRKYICI